MALDTTGNLAARLSAYITNPGASGVDTNALVSIVNDFLPAGQRVGTTDQGVTTGVYKKLGPNDIITGKNEIVTVGLWTNNTGSLNTFHTKSAQDTGNSGRYYVDVYQEVTSSTSAEVQFSIAYGHIDGKGAPSLANSDSSILSTKATYSQYRNLLLDPTDTYFTVVSGSGTLTSDINDIYVINVKRGRYKEKVDPGNWQLRLSGSNGWTDLIDDSGQKISDTVGRAGRIFNVVSGSLNLGSPNTDVNSTYATNGQGYGLFYPDIGIIVLNPAALSASVGDELTPNKSLTVYQYNQRKLFTAISGGADFQARSTENVSSNHYFVRVNNREFNYSNNPTFKTGSIGQFKHTTMEGDPKVYPTTIGLYNEANEIIAVAKMSQPIKKSFDNEMLVKVRLDF